MAPIGGDSMEGIDMVKLKEMQEIWREALDMIWEEALGKVNIGKSGRHGEYKGMPFYQWTWNLYHPDNPKIVGDGMVIHHKDLNPLNDRISNLQKMTRVEHARYHSSNMLEETKKKISEKLKGKNHPNYGKHPSNESRKRQSERMKGEKNYNFGRTGAKSSRSTPVMADYKEYSTLNEAAKYLGVVYSTIRYRIKRNKPGYSYISLNK